MAFLQAFNRVILPLKLLIPQPIIDKIPGLTTNQDIRVAMALAWMKGYALDIGCGPNRLIREYRQAGNKGLGADVHDWGGQDLLVENTAQLPFEDATFDTITMIACLNHIPNRHEVLLESRRLLKPEGRLIVTNIPPRLSMLWHKVAFWGKDTHERGMKEGEVYGFTARQVEALVADAGFVMQRKQRYSWGICTIYQFGKARE